MDSIYQAADPLNMRLTDKENMMEIEIKPTLFKIDTQEYTDEINMIKESMKEGKISIQYNGLLIDSNLEVLQVYAASLIKITIKERAGKGNMTMDEWMVKLIQKGL